MPTFATTAAAVVEQKQAGWRSPRLAKEWLRSLERFVFPNRSGNCINDTFLSQLLKELEIAAVPHGFRSVRPRCESRTRCRELEAEATNTSGPRRRSLGV